MRRLMLATVVALLLALAALLWALRSESFALRVLHWAVANFSEFQLELVNPSLAVYRGTFSADEIHVLPGDGDGPALLSALGVSASFPVALLPTGPSAASVDASSLLVYVSESEAATNPEPMQWLAYLDWLPGNLQIGQLHVVTASAQTLVIPLKQVRGTRVDKRHYRLSADADYDGEPLGATVDILALDQGWGETEAEIRLNALAPQSGSEFKLSGTLEGTELDFRYRFTLDAHYRDIHDLLKGFQRSTPLRGTLRMHGAMAGDTEGFVLSDATFVLDNLPEYTFNASGNLAYRLDGDSSLALVATGELASLSSLVDWVETDADDFGRVRSSLSIGGSLREPVIESLQLSTASDSGLIIRIDNGPASTADGGQAGRSIKTISLDVQAPSLTVLERWLGKLPFDPGHWRATAQLVRSEETMSLQDIVIESGSPDTVALRATGLIGRLELPPVSGGGDYAVKLKDIRLQVEAHTPDSAALGTLLGRSDIPAGLAVSASLEVSGDDETLQLSEGQIGLASSNLEAELGPLSAVVRPREEAFVTELTAPLTVHVRDTSALSAYTDLEVPALGPLHLNATLAQHAGGYQLLDIRGALGEGDFGVDVRGRVGDLAHGADVSLNVEVKGLETQILLNSLLPDFEYGQPLGTLVGAFALSARSGNWSVTHLTLAGGTPETALEFSVVGEINNINGLATADINSRFRLGDPGLARALTGLSLKPTQGTLKLATESGRIRGTASARVGSTQLAGDGEISFDEESVHNLRLTLSSPHVRLQDFALEEPRGSKPVEAPEATDPVAAWVARIREKSPGFPVDLHLDLGGLSGENSHLDSLRVQLTGADKRFTLAEFTAGYNQALAELRGIIDLNPQPPALSVAGQAHALPLGALLQDLGVNSDVTGTLTIQGGLTVLGDSTESTLGTLDGSVAIALEDAVIQGAAYDLLATDVLAWIYTGGLTERSTHIDCTMAKFDLRKGTATTDSLYIESARMIATGSAEFNLVQQRMDVRITPRSKTRLLQLPSEVRLKGKMSKPRTELSPINAVADAASSALMLIPSLTLKLFGVVPSRAGTFRPCQAASGN